MLRSAFPYLTTPLTAGHDKTDGVRTADPATAASTDPPSEVATNSPADAFPLPDVRIKEWVVQIRSLCIGSEAVMEGAPLPSEGISQSASLDPPKVDRSKLPAYKLPHKPGERSRAIRRWLDVLHDSVLEWAPSAERGPHRWLPALKRYQHAYGGLNNDHAFPTLDFLENDLLPAFRAITEKRSRNRRWSTLGSFLDSVDSLAEPHVATEPPVEQRGASMDRGRLNGSMVEEETADGGAAASVNSTPQGGAILAKQDGGDVGVDPDMLLPGTLVELIDLFLRCYHCPQSKVNYIAANAVKILRQSPGPVTACNLLVKLKTLEPILDLFDGRPRCGYEGDVEIYASSDTSDSTQWRRDAGELVGISPDQLRHTRHVPLVTVDQAHAEEGIKGMSWRRQAADDIAQFLPVQPYGDPALFLCKILLILSTGITGLGWTINSPSNLFLLPADLHQAFKANRQNPGILALVPTVAVLDLLIKGVLEELCERKEARLSDEQQGLPHEAGVASFWDRTIRPAMATGQIEYDLISFDPSYVTPVLQRIGDWKFTCHMANKHGRFKDLNGTEVDLPPIRFVRRNAAGEVLSPGNHPNPLLVCFDLAVKLAHWLPRQDPSPGYIERFVKVVQLVWYVLENPTNANLQDEYSPAVQDGRSRES